VSKIISGPLIPPTDNQKVKHIVIFLHGYGANGADLINIGNEWIEELPNTLFISPNAPFRCPIAENSFQWFELTSISPENIGQGLKISGPYLNDFVEDIKQKYKIEEKKIFFVGFSQGTMMALNHLCKRKSSCAGLIGYSGMLFENKGFDQEVKSKFPIFLYHGRNDDLIRYDYSIEAYNKLHSMGFNIQYRIQNNLGHGIDALGLLLGLGFIKKTLSI